MGRFVSTPVVRRDHGNVCHSGGTSETFIAGDAFFIPKRSPCTWDNTETVRKFYMIDS
jgi:uncharacterized cupin superfamily protein